MVQIIYVQVSVRWVIERDEHLEEFGLHNLTFAVN